MHDIPGLEHLASRPTCMILFSRLITLPEEQLEHIYTYLDSGQADHRPAHGQPRLHRVRVPQARRTQAELLVMTSSEAAFRGHHGRWHQDSTRGILVDANKHHPVLIGVDDIWGPSDVYRTYPEDGALPEGCTPLVMGQPLMSRGHDDAINPDLMALPVAWVKTWTGDTGNTARVFQSTMGSAKDFQSAGLRRLVVNAAYWCMGLEEQIRAKSSVEILGRYEPLASGFNYPKLGVEPHPASHFDSRSVAPVIGNDAWPQFRGPGGRSVATGAPIPTDFGPDQHVIWKTSVPGGHSSPCIQGDLLVVTGTSGENTDVVVGLDRRTGKERWRRAFEGVPHPEYSHADAVPALPTPCTDGERIVAYFGGYGLVALDMEGELLWERRLPHPGYGFGVGPSPLLADGIVILRRDGAPEAAILAFDATDGSELWKIDRFEYGESHGTPFLWRNADRDELIIAGTLRLCSYDLGTGELLWSYAGITVFPCTTPTSDRDTLYFAAWSTPNAAGRNLWEANFGRSLELTDEEIADPALLFKRLDANGDGHVVIGELPESRAKDAFTFIDRDRSNSWELEELTGGPAPGSAPGRNVMIAVERGGEGELTEDAVRWSWTRGLPYVASPLVHRDRIWLVKSGGIVTCLDAKSGDPIFGRSRLSDRSEYYLSPVGIGDVVMVGSAEGTLFLLDAGADELKVVHTAEFEEELFATPAVIDGVVYLRTKHTVWAFGQDGK